MADKSKLLNYGSECKASIGGTSMLITNFGLKAEYEWDEIHDKALLGTNRPEKGGRQVAAKDVKGAVTVLPDYTHAQVLLAEVFDLSTSTYTPMDDISTMDIDIVADKGVDVFTYANCWCNTLTLQGQEKGPVEWILDLLGVDETDEGSVTIPAQVDNMRFTDLSLSINSNTYFPKGFKWMFNYNMQERFHNSLTRSAAQDQRHECLIDLNLDLNADNYTDLQAMAGTNDTIPNVNLVFSDGTDSLTFAHPICTVMNTSKIDDIGGVDSVNADIQLAAWSADGSADAFSVTHATL